MCCIAPSGVLLALILFGHETVRSGCASGHLEQSQTCVALLATHPFVCDESDYFHNMAVQGAPFLYAFQPRQSRASSSSAENGGKCPQVILPPFPALEGEALYSAWVEKHMG